MVLLRMLFRLAQFIGVLILLLLSVYPALGQEAGEARLKDLVRLEGAMPIQLSGYGLVTGLDGSGDRARGRRGAPYTVQSLANALINYGVNVPAADIASRNVAAVFVTATLDPFQGPGSLVDVTISAIGDARSLSGGVLLQTPLENPITREMHVMAQGPVSTGAVLASTVGSSVKVNYTNTGRAPGAGIVMRALPLNLTDQPTMGLSLRRPDFTNATRIAEVINAQYPDAAVVEHAGLIRVTVPDAVTGIPQLYAALEDVLVEVDVPARVVVNERTGTIVAGGNVRLGEVMITYGSLVISTQTTPVVSQPAPFSETGETVAADVGEAAIQEESTRSIILEPNTDISQLAAALNELGLTARDVIAIFQTIDRSGNLHGELVIQ
ncbi:MAG: flagellar basal body P-ring protein FlgI [Bacteroidota bacterium]